jgi:hypothetical protein
MNNQDDGKMSVAAILRWIRTTKALCLGEL